MNTHRLPALALAALTALIFTGCTGGKKTTGLGGGGDGDFVSGTPLPDRQEGVSFLGSNVDRARFRPVYFAFDSYAIDGGEDAKIDEVASFLKGAGNDVIIAGFTD